MERHGTAKKRDSPPRGVTGHMFDTINISIVVGFVPMGQQEISDSPEAAVDPTSLARGLRPLANGYG
ncbi:MAG: hypothetical protein LBD67_03990 [Candidatus Accumulibacter sp.]|nr:hypothetical protein [Accumulibacter sp.]